MEHRKLGRPSTGPRVQIKGRVPEELRAAALRRAGQLGMTLNDYLGELLAEDTGVAYTPQEALKTA